MVQPRVIRNITSKETNQIALVTESKPNEDNSFNIKHETSTHLQNKMRKYLKGKINQLSAYTKYRNIKDLYRGIN
jgi:hypothetical protein